MTNEPGYLGQFVVIAFLSGCLLFFAIVIGVKTVEWLLDAIF
jgi:hypothetical protein